MQDLNSTDSVIDITVKLNLIPDISGTFVFNVQGVVSGFLFLKLATNWPSLMKHWDEIEKTLENSYQNYGRKKKFNILFIVVLSSACGIF